MNKTRETLFRVMLAAALSLGSAVASGCMNKESDVDLMKRDHEAISQILDKDLLSDDPKRAFENSLEKVRSYPSVDSAWISGSTFFVKYKRGGVVSWTVPSPLH